MKHMIRKMNYTTGGTEYKTQEQKEELYHRRGIM